MTLKAAIFDWDGTITDSNDIKTQAFIEMLANGHPKNKEYIINYQKKHGGISRFEKYRHYILTFFKRTVTETELKEFGQTYTALCRQKLLTCPFIPGAIETLKLLKLNKIPAFVVTGSPAEEITELATERGIADLFSGIFGSPKTKNILLKELLLQQKLKPSETIFYGDALTDYDAAQSNKIPFIGICSSQNISPFPPHALIMPQVKLDFFEIETTRKNNK